MGVYAQTDFEITCESNKVAKQVAKKLKELSEKQDENGNSFGRDIKVSGSCVSGFEDSGRIQNLEYRCGQMWKSIKDIKGVLEFSAPFMVEGDGVYFSQDEEETEGEFEELDEEDENY